MKYTLESLIKELKEQDLSGKTYFITGGNSGFGYTVSKILLKAKATVIIGCRSEERAREACNRLQEETENSGISYLLIDMTDPESINACVQQIITNEIHIHALVNNAGVSMVPTYMEAKTGVEMTCQTNYMGVVQLTEKLLPILEREEHPRCAFVTSLTYPKNPPSVIDADHLFVNELEYERFASYFRSKYLLTSFALLLARTHPHVKTVICDPGVAATNIARELGCIGKVYTWPIFQWFIPPWKGACTIAFAAASDRIDAMENGVMLRDCKKKEVIERIKDIEEQEKIYRVTRELLCRIEENGNVQGKS